MLLMFLMACSQNTIKEANGSIIDTVKQIEVNGFKLNTSKINYDDYKKNTEEFMFDYFNKDNEVILIYNEKQYTGKDLIGMPLNEYRELGNKILLKIYGSIEIKGDSVDISEVYYDKKDMDKIRYVFTKENIIIGNENITIYKKYTFLNENNTWKVSVIEDMFESSEYKLDEKILRAYKNYNNEPIEYPETIDLSKLK